MKRYIRASEYADAGYPQLDEFDDMIRYLDDSGPALSGFIEQVHQWLDEISLIEWVGDDTAKTNELNSKLSNINDHLEQVFDGLYHLVIELYEEARRQNQ